MADGRRRRSGLRRWISRIWITFGIVAFGGMVWSYQAHGVDAAVLESDARVRVVDHVGYIEFVPVTVAGSARLLFFPGGMVQLEAYAPLARRIAEAGFDVVLIRYPFLGRHAPRERDRQRVLAAARMQLGSTASDVARVVAGHSFGCVMASRLAAESPELLESLVLIASTHPREVDLSGSGLQITKILGTRDGVASPEMAREYADRLPVSTRWIEIEGGNHAQFGYYGPQLGDGRATISRAEQQRQLVELLTAELHRSSDLR